MKSKELQNLVLRLHNENHSNREISKMLRNQVSHTTINEWIRRFKESGTISLRKPSGRPRSIRTKNMIRKVKQHLLTAKKKKSTRRLAKQFLISRRSMQRLIRFDIGWKSYVKRLTPKLTPQQKLKRMVFGRWVRKHVRKSMTKDILFSDEKRFDIDGIYNKQNDRIWAPNRLQADINGGTHQKTKFPTGVMVWLGVCYFGATRPVIIEKGTINTARYIKEILPIALKDGKKLMGNKFTFQQDGASAHTSQQTQTWCKAHFWDFWPKSRWPPNSPDLNPLDYSIWSELCTQMNWSKVSNKTTLIKEIRAGTKKIRKGVLQRSINCWTNRIYRMLLNEKN